MKQYPFPKNRWYSAAFGVFLFVMLLLARDTLITSMRLGFYRSQFLMLAAVVLLGLAFLLRNRGNLREIVTDKRIFLIFAFALLILLIMILKRDWQIMYFSILLCLVFPVFLTYFTDSRRVSKYYVVILTVLGVYSVIATYLFRRLVWSGYLSAPVRVNDAGMNFYDFLLCFGVTDRFWHRNFGIFREPGVYQFFVILGLYLNNYTVDWEKEWVRWLVNLALTLTMVTTFAIGGFVETGLFALFLYFDKGYHRTKTGRLIGLGAGAAIVGMIAYVLFRIHQPNFAKTVFYEFYDMFIRLTTDSDSLMDRLSAIFTDVEFFLQHPLLGERIAPVLHGTNHNTSSTLLLYAVLGFAGGTLHLATWIALLWKKERNVLGNLILLGIFLMSFNTQNLIADVFFWLFPCMALAEWGLPKLHRKGEA
ncbi:MAG: hypothetical protein ACI3WQ_07485 [Faecousia sp.]